MRRSPLNEGQATSRSERRTPNVERRTLPPPPILGGRLLLFLFLLALGARLAVTAHFGFTTNRFGDARAYLFAAGELVRTGHYPRKTEPFYFRAPGYPLFLVAATLGNPDRIAAAKVANCLLGSFAVLLLAALAGRIFRSRLTAIGAGLAAALHPGFLVLSTDVQSEPLFLVLLLSAGFFLLAAVDRPSSNMALLSGAAAAAAALTRPSALVLLPLLAAPILDRRYPLRARAHLSGSALLGFCLLLAPWMLRNALVYRELLPVNDAGGSVFYQGNSDWTVRFYRLRSLPEYRKWSAAMFSDLERQTSAVDAASGGSPSAKTRYFVRKTLEERRGDPGGWAMLDLRKAWDWLRPYPNPLFWPKWTVWTIGTLNTVITLLAVYGMAAAPRPGVCRFVLVYLALAMVSHVVILVVWRYRITYWDPVILLYGAFGASTLLARAPSADFSAGAAEG